MTGQLKEGTLIEGRYQVVSELGTGSFASVYSARDTQMDRTVAIKVLRQHVPGGWSSERKDRFMREAQALSQLQSRSIIQVHSVGLLDGASPFIVTQFVDGRSLRDLIADRETLDCATATDICAQVADALTIAHKQGIIHRDVKPENILIGEENGKLVASLVDFGLAAWVADKADDMLRLTMTGELLGTPDYMSPEQARGSAVDPTTDIYSLGCVFFECITGVSPFAGKEGMTILWAHLNAQPPLLATLYGNAPKSMDGIIQRALEKDPANRYQSCEEMAADLRVLGQAHPQLRFKRKSVDHPPESDEKKRSKTRFAILMSAGVAVLAVVAFIGACLWNDDAALAVVDALANTSGQRIAQDVAVGLVGAKSMTEGKQRSVQFALAAARSQSLTGIQPAQQIPFVLRCLPPTERPNKAQFFPLYAFLIDDAFISLEAEKKAIDYAFASRVLHDASKALLPDPSWDNDRVRGELSEQQWIELRKTLDRHYAILAKMYEQKVVDGETYSFLKELNGLAEELRPDLDLFAARTAMKHYDDAAAPYTTNSLADSRFHRVLQRGKALDKRFDVPQKRALMQRTEIRKLLYQHRFAEAKKLFDETDALPHVSWALSGAETGEHERLRQQFYGSSPKDGKE